MASEDWSDEILTRVRESRENNGMWYASLDVGPKSYPSDPDYASAGLSAEEAVAMCAHKIRANWNGRLDAVNTSVQGRYGKHWRLKKLISEVECGEFEFALRHDGDRPYLQIQCNDKCTVTGDDYRWNGRKWFLSYHMTDSEVVQTAWAAAKMAVEHELRETFKWAGETIFRPHFDINALHEISRENRIDERV